MSPVPVTSPCRRICVLDSRGAICLGCGRTVQQIAAWPRMSEAERRAVMEELTKIERRPSGGEMRGVEDDGS